MNPQMMNLGRAAAQEYYKIYYAIAIKQKRAGTRTNTPRQWNALPKHEQQAMTEAFGTMMLADQEGIEALNSV